MDKTTVVVIGGGATGIGILRDLSMRGIKAVLLEQRDLANGTSSRFHGLLHSGGRYAVRDPQAARECIEENRVLRKVARHCVEETEGLFVRLPEDDEHYEEQWVRACQRAGITVERLSPGEARRLEPHLTSRILSAYRVPDTAIDGFRLVWQNAMSARRYGGEVRTYTRVIGIEHQNGQVAGVKVRNTLTGQIGRIACDFIVNAAGSWAGEIAALADLTIPLTPDKGTLVAFNHRFTNRVINRLRPPADGDIFVPHGSVTILGTTSLPVSRPDDTMASTREVCYLLAIGEALFPDLSGYRILRAFAGTRPLYEADSTAQGREASRGFAIIDHARDGLQGFASILGGKLTTYRLMAEKMADFVCNYLKVTAKCRTAVEPLVEEQRAKKLRQAKKYFPPYSFDRAVSRLGSNFDAVLARMEKDREKSQLVCECELVTLAELEEVAADATNFSLDDVRRKTRIGMGTCQGAFCAFRSVGVVITHHLGWGKSAPQLIKEFLQSRWCGIRPVLWGNQVRETEFMRGIYDATLNIDGAIHDAGE